MRMITLAALAALMATPALAQTTYQAPAAPGPIAPVVDPLSTGTVVNPDRPAPVGGVGRNTVETEIDSAKGGNAAMPSRLNPNLGNTSGARRTEPGPTTSNRTARGQPPRAVPRCGPPSALSRLALAGQRFVR